MEIEKAIKTLRCCTLVFILIGLAAGLCQLLEWQYPGALVVLVKALIDLWEMAKDQVIAFVRDVR